MNTITTRLALTFDEKQALVSLTLLICTFFMIVGLIGGMGATLTAVATKLLCIEGLTLHLITVGLLVRNKPALMRLWKYFEPGTNLRRNIVICFPMLAFAAACAACLLASIALIGTSLLTNIPLQSELMAEIGLVNLVPILILENYL